MESTTDRGAIRVEEGRSQEALASRVARELRTAIVEGEILPNERIKQDAVAKQLGVSRLPVREALRELATEGLVVLERDVGARVSALDPNELLETFLVRESLEALAVQEAAPRISAEELEAVHALNDRSEEFASSPVSGHGATAYLEIDRDFHRRIFAASGMDRLCSIIEGLWQTAERYRRSYSILPQSLEISVIEHRMILEALERRAPVDAAELHRIHIRRTRLTLAEHPELFPDRARAGGAEG